MTFPTFATIAGQIVDWINILLTVVLIYYGWLIFKGGTEGSTHKEAWGFGKKGHEYAKKPLGEIAGDIKGGFEKFTGRDKVREKRKAQRVASREKTALLNEYVEERKEVGLIEDAEAKVELFEVKYTDFKSSSGAGTSLKAVKSSFKETTDAVDAAAKEMTRLKKVTFRQERKYQQLITALEDAEVKEKDINEVKAIEASLLTEHEKVLRALQKVHQALAKIDSEIKKTKAALLATTVPISNYITAVKRALSDTKDTQNQAYNYCKNLIVVFKKYWK